MTAAEIYTLAALAWMVLSNTVFYLTLRVCTKAIAELIRAIDKIIDGGLS